MSSIPKKLISDTNSFLLRINLHQQKHVQKTIRQNAGTINACLGESVLLKYRRLKAGFMKVLALSGIIFFQSPLRYPGQQDI